MTDPPKQALSNGRVGGGAVSSDELPSDARSGNGVLSDDLIAGLDAAGEIRSLRERLASWLEGVDDELREPLAWAFAGTAKHFRPLTLFACHRAAHQMPPSEETIELAFAVELIHNMSLIVDDVLDGSAARRGCATLERRFGRLPALMASGYLVADAFDAFAEDPFAVRHLSELLRRLGAAECLQWRLRRRPLGVEDWRRIAHEDTGSMFEICAVLGARSQRLRSYGNFLGVLYHGCDDVADQRGVDSLGGGGEDDIRDGILTLPAALAIRDPDIREQFGIDDDDPDRLAALADACRARLPDAEAVLERIADSARAEALRFAADPEPLLVLVDRVSQLSRR
jgi:geranylgeranyl pyrophosphate synthase